MRFFLIILLLQLLPATAQCGDAQVDISADIVGINYVGLKVQSQLMLPTMYNNVSGTITSEDPTVVPGETQNGQNGLLSARGSNKHRYSLQFDDYTNLTNGTDTVRITLEVYGGKTGRSFGSLGTDKIIIKGSSTFSGEQLSVGYYTNSAHPTVITATYDD
jgi:hypothetical protein